MSGNSSTQSTDGALRALFTLCREPRSLLYLLQSSPGEEHMDIIAQLKAERDKAAQQVNALDTAIRALSGIAASTWPDFWEIASACAQNFLRMLGAIGIDLFAPNDLSLCFFSV